MAAKKLTIEQRVARGVKFMNTEYGKEWLRRIDPEALALASDSACVLGQVEGGFSIGVEKLKLANTDIAKLGFCLYYDDDDGYSKLTKAWKKSIVKLQKLFKIEPRKEQEVH